MKFQKIHPDAKIPTRATPFTAGLDLFAIDDFEIPAGELRIIGLGIISEFGRHWVAIMKDRDSLASRGIVVAGGVVNSGDVREWRVILRNTQPLRAFRGSRGDPIAQVVFLPLNTDQPEESQII